jgi:CBS domain-containing protein
MVRVRDVMTRDVLSVSPQLSLRDLVELLATEHIGGAPVVAGGNVVGVVTMDDVLTFLSMVPGVPAEQPENLDFEAEPVGEWEEGEEAPGAFFADMWSDAGADTVERLRSVGSPEWDLLSERTVAEAMSRAIVSVRPSDDLATAAHRMEGANVHRVLVMERGALVGIVTTSDVTRAVAQARV